MIPKKTRLIPDARSKPLHFSRLNNARGRTDRDCETAIVSHT